MTAESFALASTQAFAGNDASSPSASFIDHGHDLECVREINEGTEPSRKKKKKDKKKKRKNKAIDAVGVEEEPKRKRKNRHYNSEGDAVGLETAEKSKKKKRSKKQQTQQEEESAQALLALGLASAEAKENPADETARAAGSDAANIQEPSSPRKVRSGRREFQSAEFVEDSDEDMEEDALPTQSQAPLQKSTIMPEARSSVDPSTAALTTDYSSSSAIQNSLPANIPIDALIQEHLKAHVSNTAQPQEGIPVEQRLQQLFPQSFRQYNNQGQFGTPLTDPAAQLQAEIERAEKDGKVRKRKRANTATMHQSVMPLDPALMNMDFGIPQSAAITKFPSKKVTSKTWGNSTPSANPAVNGGTFSIDERYAIDLALGRYAQVNGLQNNQLRDRVWGNQRKKDDFWDKICEAVPDRPRASVYKHVRRSHHVFEERAKWTDEQDEQLSKLVQEKGNKWREIGLEMGRMGEDCRDRYRNYVKCGNKRGTDRWSEEEEQLLKLKVKEQKEAVKEHLRKSGKSHEIPAEGQDDGLINWTAVSDLMDNRRSRIQCRYKWNKMLAQKERISKAPAGVTYVGGKKRRVTFDPSNMIDGDKVWLLERIRLSGAQHENQIPWDNIAKEDPLNIWTHRDLKAAYKQFRAGKPHTRRPLLEIIRELLRETDSLPDSIKQARFQPSAAQLAGMQPTHSQHQHLQYVHQGQQSQYQQPQYSMANAPIASMAMMDPQLFQADLEKTAAEAIAVNQAQQHQNDGNETESERELRRQLNQIVREQAQELLKERQ